MALTAKQEEALGQLRIDQSADECAARRERAANEGAGLIGIGLVLALIAAGFIAHGLGILPF